MTCPNCQREIADYSNFCYYCGSRQQSAPPRSPLAAKRLMRSSIDSKIGGVCAGFADSKYRPCPLLRKMVAAGWLGRKSGRGFYNYAE